MPSWRNRGRWSSSRLSSVPFGLPDRLRNQLTRSPPAGTMPPKSISGSRGDGMRHLGATLALALALQLSASSALAWQDWPSEWNPGRPMAGLGVVEATADPRAVYSDRYISPDGAVSHPEGRQPLGRLKLRAAVLGMVLDAYGATGQATDDLRFRAHTYQGTVGMRTGTALEHIAHVAEDFGVETHGLYNASGGFNAWSLDDIRGQLRLGRPVMPLVRLYLVPGWESMAPRWGHYILLTGMTPDGFYFNDPLQVDARAGMSRFIPSAQLAAAIGTSHIPGQAVAFGPARPDLEIWTPQG